LRETKMYTMTRNPLARLRAYRHELEREYARAIEQRDVERARRLQLRRRSVVRAILIREEWADDRSSDPELDDVLFSILHGA
jgi:hypothetical protein